MPNDRETCWLISESGDRWYRAVCRFAPSKDARTNHRIERICGETTKSILAKMRSLRGRIIVLWELPNDPSERLSRLDQVVAIRTEAAAALQIAALSTTASAETFLAAQEAGIALFLENLGSVSIVNKALSGHFSPLG